MKCLTNREDWSPDYRVDDVSRRLGEIEMYYNSNRNLRELWDDILLPLLRTCGAQSAVEIGSAPGQNLIELARGLGITPFGIEYTEEGAQLNRRLFVRNGLSPDNVINEDFFSPTLDTHFGRFDITLSFGFVEHFDDPTPVIRRQIDFCRIGGHAVIVIPNIQGLYYVWNNTFNRRVIETHNTTMMKDQMFFKLCEGIGNLEIIFSGAVGAFDYGLLTHNGKFFPRAGISVLRRMAPVLHVFDKYFLANLGLGQPPYLMVVGKRIG